MLVAHFAGLDFDAGARIAVPLCGKSLDLHWFLSQGYEVVGMELVESAIVSLFEELGAEPTITPVGDLKRYSAKGIDVLVGDIFNVNAADLGTVDAVYDRAALVALPEDMRRAYASHLLQITKTAPQLLVSFEYDQTQMPGPPFSVSTDEIAALYADQYDIEEVDRVAVEGKLKGVVEADEVAWRLYAR